MINRKLNTTPLLFDELRTGNVVYFDLYEQYVVTGKEEGLIQIERFSRDYGTGHDVYDLQTVNVERVLPVPLWTAGDTLAHYLLSALGFERKISGWHLGTVRVTDDFWRHEQATVGCAGNITPVWYLHELQNAVQDYTGVMPLSEMGSMLLRTQNKSEALPFLPVDLSQSNR